MTLITRKALHMRQAAATTLRMETTHNGVRLQMLMLACMAAGMRILSGWHPNHPGPRLWQRMVPP